MPRHCAECRPKGVLYRATRAPIHWYRALSENHCQMHLVSQREMILFSTTGAHCFWSFSKTSSISEGFTPNQPSNYSALRNFDGERRQASSSIPSWRRQAWRTLFIRRTLSRDGESTERLFKHTSEITFLLEASSRPSHETLLDRTPAAAPCRQGGHIRMSLHDPQGTAAASSHPGQLHFPSMVFLL